MRKLFLTLIITSIIFNNIFSQIIPKDKQLHIGAGAVIGAWGTLTTKETTGWKPIVMGIGWATAAGVGKELADMGGLGTPEWRDLEATVIGGVIGVGILTGVNYIVRKHKSKRHCKVHNVKYNVQPHKVENVQEFYY